MKSKTKILICCLLLGLTVSNFAAAAIVNCGQASKLPANPTADQIKANECQITDLIFLIERIINYLLSWAWLVSILYILWASYQMMISGGNQETLDKGKETLKNALLGFFLIMISYLLINLVIFIVTGQGGQDGANSFNIFRNFLPPTKNK